MPRKTIAAEAVVDLRRRLSTLTPRSPERRRLMQETAALYGISEPTLYRILQRQTTPHALRRADFGVPRVLPKAERERYNELIAPGKGRTSDRKSRHASTPGRIPPVESRQTANAQALTAVPTGPPHIPTF